jgi:hypothetical protein
MRRVLLKAVGVWLVILVVAILNAALREMVVAPLAGPGIALPLSGVLLSLLVFAVAWLSLPFIAAPDETACVYIGLLWLGLTLAFEFLFGHFIAGKPWHELIQVFDLRRGDLFSVVLLVTALAPWAAGKLRGRC